MHSDRVLNTTFLWHRENITCKNKKKWQKNRIYGRFIFLKFGILLPAHLILVYVIKLGPRAVLISRQKSALKCFI